VPAGELSRVVEMSDTPPEDFAVAPGIDREAVRQRAFELSQVRPNATAEENWLLAEAELVAAATDPDRRATEAEEAATLMSKIQMTIHGHP